MQCTNCGKRNQVTIKGKLFCANCGNVLAGNKLIEDTAINSEDSGHVLDLSAIIQPRKHKPSQSIHGVRKSSKAPQKLTSVKRVDIPARVGRANAARKHPQISKFGSIHKQAEQHPQKPTVSMAPNRIYAVTDKPTKSNLNQSAHSTHHEQPKKKFGKNVFSRLNSRIYAWLKKFRGNKRPIPAVAAIFAVIVLAAYVTYLNVPTIAVRIAAARAGIDAQMPDYRPPGYSYDGPIHFEKGKVQIRFTSNSDSRFLSISQEKTHWDSETLRQNISSESDQPPRRNLHNGLAIYVYGENNQAAWINNGVLYKISGTYLLVESQILRIASSL